MSANYSKEQPSMTMDEMGVCDQSSLMQIYMEEMISWKKLHPHTDSKDNPEFWIKVSERFEAEREKHSGKRLRYLLAMMYKDGNTEDEDLLPLDAASLAALGNIVVPQSELEEFDAMIEKRNRLKSMLLAFSADGATDQELVQEPTDVKTEDDEKN